MTATLLYRVAAIVFVLFAVGHTYGFLSLRAPSAEGRAVYDSMNAVRFELRGRSYSLRRFLPRLRLVLQLPGVVLSLLYVGPPPMVLSVVVALILGCAAWLTGR